MTKPLLTLAIPTSNRPEELEILLESIAAQFDGLEDLIQIIVSDNASGPATDAVVSKFLLRIPIVYLKNSINIGMDGNFTQCFREASGDYVWLFGDDDVLLPGALQTAIDLCRRDPLLIHFRPLSFVGAFVPPRSLPPRITVGEYVSSAKFAREVNVMVTFISGMIASKA